MMTGLKVGTSEHSTALEHYTALLFGGLSSLLNVLSFW